MQARYAPEPGPSKLTVLNRNRSQNSWIAASPSEEEESWWPLEDDDAMAFGGGAGGLGCACVSRQ